MIMRLLFDKKTFAFPSSLAISRYFTLYCHGLRFPSVTDSRPQLLDYGSSYGHAGARTLGITIENEYSKSYQSVMPESTIIITYCSYLYLQAGLLLHTGMHATT
jgi:hypothetical protein